MNNLKIIVISALAATLAACNSSPAPTGMTREAAVNLKTIAPLAMNGLANSIRQGGSSVVATGLETGKALAARYGSDRYGSALPLSARLTPQEVSGTCGPSAAPIDADNDKVPSSLNFVYNCAVVFSPSFKFTATGPVTSTDTNDNDPASGYTTSGDVRYAFVFTNTGNGQTSSFSFIVKWSATATIGAGGAYNITTDQRLIFQPDTTKNEYSYTLTASYLPDADGNAQRFDAGTISFDGTVAYTDAKAALSRFRLVSSDLHFGGACPKGIDRGTLVSEDQSNIGVNTKNRFELKASACDMWVATYNGETLF